jgi:hypothetical protein
MVRPIPCIRKSSFVNIPTLAYPSCKILLSMIPTPKILFSLINTNICPTSIRSSNRSRKSVLTIKFLLINKKCMQKTTSYIECSFSNWIIFSLLHCYKNHITVQWMNWTKEESISQPILYPNQTNAFPLAY